MYYLYKVTYYDSYNDKEEAERGLIFAEDYGKAASQVRYDYGSDLIDMYLQELDTRRTISEEEINSAMK